MFDKKYLRMLCLLLGALSIVAGVAGMVLSFTYLATATLIDATAGGAGFVAGAILAGSGLIACALMASPRASGNDNG
jgi:hypothetical protein